MAYQKVILVDGVAYPASVINDLSAAVAELSGGYYDERVLGSSAASVVFSGIPTTLRSVVVDYTVRGDGAGGAIGVMLRINGDAGTNYFGQINSLINTSAFPGNTFGGTSMQVGAMPGSTAGAGQYAGGEVKVIGWNAPHPKINFVGRSDFYDSAANSFLVEAGGLYNVAGPYTSLTLIPASGNFVAGSQFVLTGR